MNWEARAFARRSCNTGKMPAYMLQGNAYGEAHAKTDDKDETDMEYVEVDPTKRYGRYKEILGQGACKTVYKAFDKLYGVEVAWNQVNVQNAMTNSKELERLHSEVNLLKTLKHKNILKFYDSWVDTKTKTVNFITEMFSSGNLRQYRKKHKRVDLKAVKSWARQILRGLLYLHSHDPPIIHRDIKCDNIFINGNDGEVKIGDLGLAVALQQSSAAHSVIGTPEFMAPELYEEEYTELVDIYSFGMCLLELITLEYPYSECRNAAQIYKKVTSGKKPACLAKVKDPEVRSFVEKCLADASCRLPARELLMDPFLQGLGNMETSTVLPNCHSQTYTNETMELNTILAERSRVVDSEVGKRNKDQIKDFMHSHQVPVSLVSDFQKMDVDVHQQIKEVSSLNLTEPSHQSSQDLSLRSIKEDEIISFTIRIGDKKGHSRCIHFRFNPEADTALSVASEMIAALGLADQDAIAIAEKIDSELTTLAPHWKPGAAFDDTVDEENSSDELLNADRCTAPPKDEVRVEAFSSERPVLELLSSSHRPSCSSTITSSDDNISCDFPTICGHLEEARCNSCASDDSCQSGEFLSSSSDNQEAGGVFNIEDPRSELIFSSSLYPSAVKATEVTISRFPATSLLRAENAPPSENRRRESFGFSTPYTKNSEVETENSAFSTSDGREMKLSKRHEPKIRSLSSASMEGDIAHKQTKEQLQKSIGHLEGMRMQGLAIPRHKHIQHSKNLCIASSICGGASSFTASRLQKATAT